MRLVFTCASANSHTSNSASEHSAAPVPEARTEPVRHRSDPEVPGHLRNRQFKRCLRESILPGGSRKPTRT